MIPTSPKSLGEFLDELPNRNHNLANVEQENYHERMTIFVRSVRSEIERRGYENFLQAILMRGKESEEKLFEKILIELTLIFRQKLNTLHIERIATLVVDDFESAFYIFKKAANDPPKKEEWIDLTFPHLNLPLLHLHPHFISFP